MIAIYIDTVDHEHVKYDICESLDYKNKLNVAGERLQLNQLILY